ncbi:MAG: L,D-transpeptidase [Actinomycetota bacterium]|nr:L,D-transpeptidase [Actinomycetota bacterium]
MSDIPELTWDPKPESHTPPARRRGRPLALVLAVLPLLPILVGVVITSRTVPAQALSPGGYRPLAAAPASLAAPGATLPRGPGAVVAILRSSTTMRRAPEGRAFGQVQLRTGFASPVAMWVVALHPGWLGVISPVAGNGRVGWIPRPAAALSRVNWRLQVSLGERRLTVLLGGRPVERYTVAVGRPSAPTPTGRFSVTDRLNTGDPSGPYGCCILALSALAPHAIQGWNGGNRIAIHSTPETASIGKPVSHGCLRLSLPAGRWLLAHIPLGTPTIIRS